MKSPRDHVSYRSCVVSDTVPSSHAHHAQGIEVPIFLVGTIFKRFDTAKLFTVTCQDVVERFHLGLAMLFVIAEEMDNTTSSLPNMGLIWKCTQIFLAEIVIDVTKHAVLGKFNEIRPGVYREYTRVIPNCGSQPYAPTPSVNDA